MWQCGNRGLLEMHPSCQNREMALEDADGPQGTDGLQDQGAPQQRIHLILSFDGPTRPSSDSDNNN